MNTYQPATFGRQLGMDAIEQRLTDIALLTRKTFPHYAWESNQKMLHPVMHRVHIYIADHGGASLEFTNQQVLTYSLKMRRCAIDHQMSHAINKAMDTSLTG